MGEYFTSGLFCLQRKHLACEYFLTFCFSRGGVVSASPNPQFGGPPLVGCPLQFIQFIHSYPPYRRPYLHPQPEDAPCRGDRDPQTRLFSPYITLILEILYYVKATSLKILVNANSTCKFIINSNLTSQVNH